MANISQQFQRPTGIIQPQLPKTIAPVTPKCADTISPICHHHKNHQCHMCTDALLPFSYPTHLPSGQSSTLYSLPTHCSSLTPYASTPGGFAAADPRDHHQPISMVMATEKKTTLVVEDAGGGEAMQCPDHPYRTNPGGVCAFCLQEKLGKLVSSSKSSSPFSALHHTLPSPSPSPSPPSSSSSSSFPLDPATTTSSSSRRSRISSFLHRKKNKKIPTTTSSTKASHHPTTANATFTRSKSVAGGNPPKTTPAAVLGDSTPLDSPRKRWFWSFLHPQTRSSALGAARERERTRNCQSSKISGFPCIDPNPHPSSHLDATRHVEFGGIPCNNPSLNPSRLVGENNNVNVSRCSRPCKETKRPVENNNVNASGCARPCNVTKRYCCKCGAVETAAGVETVGRSRSVGCGSRSFSGDFLERISTGLGDCTLRRVESQREGKAAAAAGVVGGGGGGGDGRIVVRRMSVSGPTADDADDRSGQQRARCAGIFGMAMAAAGAEEDGGGSRETPRARGKGWGWALASPIRVLRTGARGHVEGSQEGGERKGSVTAGSAAGGGGGAASSLVYVGG